jgi:hypothetical protein
MRSKTPLLVLGLLTLAAALPAADAQDKPGIYNPDVSTPSTLYFHINGFQNFPINTQKPSDEFSEEANIGLTTNTLSCVPDNPATGGLTGKKYHTFYGFASPSYVEYNFTEDGKPRIHPERGLSYDVVLDPSQPFRVVWYLSTTTRAPAQGGVEPDMVPLVIPEVSVRATMRTRAEVSIGDAAFNAGQLVAQGETVPARLAGPLTEGANHTQIGDKHIYEFSVPMTLASNIIPKADAYNMRIDVVMKVPTCDTDPDKTLMPNIVNVWSSPEARPRMHLAIMDPIRIEYMHPQFIGDELVIHTSSNSPWGNYDVDEQANAGTCYTEGGITLRITGPSQARSLCRAAVVQRTHEHDHHMEAVDVSYIWPYKQDGAQDGKYTIVMEVQNDQHTATARGVAQFEIGKDLKVTRCGNTSTVAGADTREDCVDEFQNTNGEAITPTQESASLQLVGVLGVLGLMAIALRRRA